MHAITDFIEKLITGWVGEIESAGYWGIFVLMAIESSFIPFPSEIVMIPAGGLAAEGKLSLWGSIFAGIGGSLTGSLFNYYFALYVGRAFLLKYGKYFFVPADKVVWAEKHWNRHGELTTFVCRLLPAIRQLISIPAGLARMKLWRFCLWTTLGAGIWVMILTFTGYYFEQKARDWWTQYKDQITLGLAAVSFVVVVAYVTHMVMNHKKAAAPRNGDSGDPDAKELVSNSAP